MLIQKMHVIIIKSKPESNIYQFFINFLFLALRYDEKKNEYHVIHGNLSFIKIFIISIIMIMAKKANASG